MVWATMDVLLCTASIWHMCTMSLDRYCTLRYPISYGRSRTRTSVGLKIAFVWVVSTAVCTALAVNGFADYSNVYVEGQCLPAVKDFILYGSIFAFYVPLVIMVITYVMTVRILAENRRTMASLGLQSTAGGDRKAGNGDWITRRHKWDRPVASAIGNAPRQTDGPLTGRYRRKSTVPHSPAHAAKPPALRRNRVDDQSNVSSSVAARRRHSDGNLVGALDGRSGNDLSMRRSFSSSNNLTLAQPSSHDPDPQRDTRQDFIPQPGWVTLSSPKALSSPSDFTEQQRRQFASRQCFTSPIKSDRLYAVAPCCQKQTASSDISACNVENIYDRRRRLSDGALLDYGQTQAKNQRLDRKMYSGSAWSPFHRRRQRLSYAEVCDTMSDLVATPLSWKSRPPAVGQLRNSAHSFATDSSIGHPDQQTKCSRFNSSLTPEISNEESIRLLACGVGTNRSRTQRSQPEQKDCQRNSTESSICNKSTKTDCDWLTGWSASIRTALRNGKRTKERVSYCDETRWSRSGEATAGKIPEDRATTVKWSLLMRRRPTADISVTLSSASLSRSEAANHFQMSTYRRSCNSVSTQTSLDVMSTSAAALKHHRTIASKERRASKVLGIIFAVFLLLWTPFFVVNVLSVVCDSCLEALGSTGMSSLVWLGYASSLANPIVYTMFSTSFRTVFYRILTCRMFRRRRGIQSGTTYPLSRQVTLGDAAANGRQGQLPPETTGPIGRSSNAVSQRQTGTCGGLAQCPGS